MGVQLLRKRPVVCWGNARKEVSCCLLQEGSGPACTAPVNSSVLEAVRAPLVKKILTNSWSDLVRSDRLSKNGFAAVTF